jgi:cell division initiation protein
MGSPDAGGYEVLEPDDVQEREFAIRADGYDPDEVDQFVSEVVETIASLKAEAERAPDEADGAVPTSFSDIGKAAQRVLEAADQSATEIVEAARGEAERLREEARSDRELAARELEELEERQREHAERERHAGGAIRSAGESARQLLTDAAAPREQLVATLDEARRLLLDRFEEAEQVAERVGQRAQEVAQELEAELPLDFEDAASEEDPRAEGLASASAGESQDNND